MEATPRPWTFDPKSEEVWSPEGLVATVKQRGPLVESDGDYRLPETEANGEYIVRAVNAHARLVEALENALKHSGQVINNWTTGGEDVCLVCGQIPTPDAHDEQCWVPQARAALALAREEVE